MPEHSNAAVVRRGYEAFASGDAETLAALIAEDAVWHVGGRNLFSDTYQGREAIFTYFRKLREFTNDSLASSCTTCWRTTNTPSRSCT